MMIMLAKIAIGCRVMARRLIMHWLYICAFIYVFGGWPMLGHIVTAIFYVFIGIVLICVFSSIYISAYPEVSTAAREAKLTWHGLDMTTPYSVQYGVHR